MRAVPTKDSVIIEPADYDKGTAAQHIFSKYPESDRPDFLFVAGNDRDDEVVFKWAKELKENWIIRAVNTVTLGERNSLASSTLPNGTTGKLFHNYVSLSILANGNDRSTERSYQALQGQAH